jgi:hypothetical protein
VHTNIELSTVNLLKNFAFHNYFFKKNFLKILYLILLWYNSMRLSFKLYKGDKIKDKGLQFKTWKIYG